jgi:prepilin-type N-terminal cleavage/methylation domain-containing protein
MQPTNNQQSKTEKAFTLIELLVVIAIVGILAGLAVVNMSGATEAARIAKLKVYSNSIRSSLMGDRVSEWKFDEGSGTSTADTVGSNNGTVAGTPAWKTGADCVSGSCLNFGAGSYVNCGSPGSLDITGNITLEAWIKPALINTYGIISKIDGGGVGAYGLWTRSTGSFEILLDNPDSGWVSASSPANTVKANEWNHLVGIWNGTQLKVYYNGVQAGTSNYSGRLVAAAQNLTIGALTPGSYIFNGPIDEVRIYSQALTASNIEENYLAGLDKLLAKGAISGDEYLQRKSNLILSYAANK